jgi:hypothetical protein
MTHRENAIVGINQWNKSHRLLCQSFSSEANAVTPSILGGQVPMNQHFSKRDDSIPSLIHDPYSAAQGRIY